METTRVIRGEISYNPDWGHVCACTELGVCGGHPASESDPMGKTVYCDGSCNTGYPEYENTVEVDRSVEPTDSGSYYYRCSRCGADGWSGC